MTHRIPTGLSLLSLPMSFAYLQAAQKTVFAHTHESQKVKITKLSIHHILLFRLTISK